MEFTYDGMVRYAFGFQNPNHAAALFCLLLPLLWAAMIVRRSVAAWVTLGAMTASLLLMLALTYSRTGMLVMLGELVLFACLCRRESRRNFFTLPSGRRHIGSWVGVTAIVLIFAVASVIFGATERLIGWIANPDRAFTNRFVIWRGGLSLFAANPFGVGQGNSGLLFTSCMAPDESGIVVRTMVNSFLTVLVEYGAGWGLVTFGILTFAVVSGWFGRRGGMARVAALTALIGGVVSATLSTCFDPSVLRDGEGIDMALMQVDMAWLLWLILVALVFFLWVVGWADGLSRSWRFLATSTGLSLFLLASMYGIGRVLADDRVPTMVWVDGTAFALLHFPDGAAVTTMVLYDDKESFPTMVAWMRKWKRFGRVYLPLSPWHWRIELPNLPISRLMLQGKCAYLFHQVDAMPMTLISPPDDLPRPVLMDELFLRRYKERASWPLKEGDPLRVEYY